MHFNNPVFVLGSFETALGVVWSLGKELKGRIYSLDYKKDITFYSRYSKSHSVPNPLIETKLFLERLIAYSIHHNDRPVLFITADDFLTTVSNNYELLSKYFLFNLSESGTLNKLRDKFDLYNLALAKNIPVPVTYKVNAQEDLCSLLDLDLKFPLFLKGLDVNLWRKNIHGSLKGFVVNNKEELEKRSADITKANVPFIAQEIIAGPDTNHYKVCVYYSQEGKQLLNFTLRKIRQNPVHFGVGVVVDSVKYQELEELGTKLFDSINFRGVGSAEFKLDESDGKLKLIEINARYWQQNYLATVCGMNFPLIDYLEVTNQNPMPVTSFKTGMKWVNRYMDLSSFLDYRKERTLSFNEWRKSLRGKKVYSDFTWSDPIPALYEIGFGKKIFNIPKYFLKKLCSEKEN